MDLHISTVDAVTRAVLEGRLDSTGVDQIEKLFLSGVLTPGTHAIVDLAKVTFLASLGIRMLLSTARSLNGTGAKFALFGASPTVNEILETTALSEIIPVLETESEAIAVVTA